MSQFENREHDFPTKIVGRYANRPVTIGRQNLTVPHDAHDPRNTDKPDTEYIWYRRCDRYPCNAQAAGRVLDVTAQGDLAGKDFPTGKVSRRDASGDPAREVSRARR